MNFHQISKGVSLTQETLDWILGISVSIFPKQNLKHYCNTVSTISKNSTFLDDLRYWQWEMEMTSYRVTFTVCRICALCLCLVFGWSIGGLT